jgi:Fe-S-cluster containining protein
MVEEKLKRILDQSKAQIKSNNDFFKRAKKKPKKKVDDLFHQAHDEVFQEIDCLSCANCCKTTSPIFTELDIKRLSKMFKRTKADFIDEYLKIDEDNDYVLKQSPCPFLNTDNTCFVYDVRPQACREYPHTNRKNMFQILNLTKANTQICPAVVSILEKIKPAL